MVAPPANQQHESGGGSAVGVTSASSAAQGGSSAAPVGTAVGQAPDAAPMSSGSGAAGAGVGVGADAGTTDGSATTGAKGITGSGSNSTAPGMATDSPAAGAGTANAHNTSGPHAPSSPSEALSPSQTAAILAYFRKRGFKKGEDTLKAELDALASGTPSAQVHAQVESRFGSPTITLFDLAVKSAPREANANAGSGGSASGGGGGGGGGSSSSSSNAPASTANGHSSGPLSTHQQQQFNSMGTIEQAAVEALLLDPTDRAAGFKKLRNWCEGSLDIYQPELRPLLLPLFVHGYLDLVEMGYGAAAAAFYTANSLTFLPHHAVLLSTVRSISLPSHVDGDALAQRFRTERYVVKMSASVFSLLLGWLTDGSGPIGGAGAGEGVGEEGKSDQDKRAREAMLRILNERCRVQVLDAKPQELTPQRLEEGTGLTGAGPSFSTSTARSRRYPALQAAVVSERDAVQEYNAAAAGPKLKLGATIPLNEKLQVEVEKEVRDLDRQEGIAQGEGKDGKSTAAKKEGEAPSRGPDLIQPTLDDLPPQPPVYRTVDIQREVARVRDARKALRFDLSINTAPSDSRASTGGVAGPSFMHGVRDESFNALGEEGARAARVAALPSVCAYTYHDASDGLTCSSFSEDLSLMAAGFEESYVQVWSLKGQPLRGLKSNFSMSEIRDRKSLDRHRENTILSTRKLIGHSGPVYDVSFDPVGGSAAPPRHLLSASGDATVRLWNLDTFSALVSYRGHNQPIWSVEWSPLGIYFATASADRTARLWSTERVNPLRMYVGHLSDVDCLNFHSNSLYLATGSSDKTCRLWDVQRGACVRLFVGHQSAINCVKISPDGRYLASAGAGNAPSAAGSADDCSVSLWDLGSGRRIKKMWGHTAPVLAMDFSADGSVLMTSGSDCQVRCWDVKGAGGPRKPTDMLSMPAPATPAANNNADAGSDATRKAAEATDTSSANGKSLAVAGGAGTGATDAVPSTRGGGDLSFQQEQQHQASSADCITTFYTKRTPMLDVHFTQRNLCVVAGAFDASL